MQSIQKILFLSFLCLQSKVGIGNVLSLSQEADAFALGRFIEYLEDTDSTLDIKTISLEPGWVTSADDSPNIGFSPSRFWARVRVKNLHPNEERWYLEFANSQIDSIRVYQGSSKQVKLLLFDTGDHVQFDTRPISNRNFIFPIHIDQGQTTEIILEIKSEGSINLPITLYTADKLFEKIGDEIFFHALFYGIIIVMVFYNLFLFSKIGERSYIYYVLYIGAYGLLVFTLSGFSFKYLWPQAPWLNSYANPCLIAMSSAGLCIFTVKFIGKENLLPSLQWALYGIFGVAMLAIGLALVSSYSLASRATSALPPITIFASILASSISYGRGFKPARYIVLAFITFLIGSTIYTLKIHGFVAQNHFTEHAMQIGSAMEVILLSLALGDRIRRMQVISEHEIKNLNENLERKVEQKTKEVRVLLDNVSQGILSIGIGGIIGERFSAHAKIVFGDEELAGTSFYERILLHCSLSEDQKDQCWQTIQASLGQDLIGFEINKPSLPQELNYTEGERQKVLRLTWDVQEEKQVIHSILVTFLDITEERRLETQNLENDRQFRKVRQLISITPEQAQKYFSTAVLLLDEIHQIIQEHHSIPSKEKMRLLFLNAHTVKGGARTLGLIELAEVMHKVERSYDSILKDLDNQGVDDLRLDVELAIETIRSYISVNDQVLNRSQENATVRIERRALESIYCRVKSLLNGAEVDRETYRDSLLSICTFFESVLYEDLRKVFEEYKQHGIRIAKDIGRVEPQFNIEIPTIFIPSRMREALDSCMIHILRNALSHGIEDASERHQAGKPRGGIISLRATLKPEGINFVIEDDGRGLAIHKLKEKGLELGMIDSTSSIQDVASLVFYSGVSTADSVDILAGRGLGMDAVKKMIEDIGGRAEVVLGQEVAESKGYYRFSIELFVPLAGEANPSIQALGA